MNPHAVTNEDVRKAFSQNPALVAEQNILHAAQEVRKAKRGY